MRVARKATAPEFGPHGYMVRDPPLGPPAGRGPGESEPNARTLDPEYRCREGWLKGARASANREEPASHTHTHDDDDDLAQPRYVCRLSPVAR